MRRSSPNRADLDQYIVSPVHISWAGDSPARAHQVGLPMAKKSKTADRTITMSLTELRTMIHSTVEEALRRRDQRARIVNSVRNQPPDASDAELSECFLARIPEVAEVLCVSSQTIYRMIKEGDLTAVKVRDNNRIPWASVHEYIQRHRVRKI